MILSRLLHFYKRGLTKSTMLCSSSSSSSKYCRENSMKDYIATEQNSQVEDSDLNKEKNLVITKPAFLQSISWNSIKGTLSNLQTMFRSPKCHNKMPAEGTVSVGDKMPSENIMTENGLQKRENNTMTSEAIMNSQNCEEHISTSFKSNITEGNCSPDMETNSGDTVSILMENKVEIKQFTDDNFSDTLENMVASDINKRNIDSNSSEFSKNGSVFQSSKAIVDSETKKKYSPENETSYIARKRSSEDTRQSELNHAGDLNQVVELMSDILGALQSETQYVSRSTSQLPHNTSEGLQKDATDRLTSIGQGNQRNDKKTKKFQKLKDSFGFRSGQCDHFSKDEDMENLNVNSVRDQTSEKVPIMKSNLSDGDILQKTRPISNNIYQVFKSISKKKSQGLNGSHDYDPERNHLLQSGLVKMGCSTSQLPHNASKGLQKDATKVSIGQGNQRNDKKTKNFKKLGDGFGFSEVFEQCDRSSKDEDLANLIVNSIRDQTTEKVPIMKSNLSDANILQKIPPVSNNIYQVFKSISKKKSPGLNGSQDYDLERNHLLQRGFAEMGCSTSQLQHNAFEGLQKDATNELNSTGQGNPRNDKKTKNSQKLGDSFSFSQISRQCDLSSKDEDLESLIVNSVRDQTNEKVPIMKGYLSDDDILQKIPSVSNNIYQVFKSISKKKSQGLNGSQDYVHERNHLLLRDLAKSKVGNKTNKNEDSLSGTPLRTIGDVRKTRSNLEVAAEDRIKLKSNSQINLSTGQGNLSEDTSKCFIQEGSTENKALVRFLHKNVEDKMLYTVFKHCGVIKKIQLLSSIEGSYFKDAYVYFETREALEKALLKKDLMIGRGDAFLEPSPNQISIPNLIDDIDIPVEQVKNPTRTVMIQQLTSDIKLHQLKDALGLCKSGISSFFKGSTSSVGFLEFESEDAKERAVATHTIHVRGKPLALYRIDVPRTTIIRISNFNDLADSKIMSTCKSLGKVKRLSFRGETIVDVHFKLAEWPKMLSIVNSLNGMEVEGNRLVAQPAPYFPPEILKVLWSHPQERNHVISVVRQLLQSIEDPLQSKRVGMLAAKYYIDI